VNEFQNSADCNIGISIDLLVTEFFDSTV